MRNVLIVLFFNQLINIKLKLLDHVWSATGQFLCTLRQTTHLTSLQAKSRETGYWSAWNHLFWLDQCEIVCRGLTLEVLKKKPFWLIRDLCWETRVKKKKIASLIFWPIVALSSMHEAQKWYIASCRWAVGVTQNCKITHGRLQCAEKWIIGALRSKIKSKICFPTDLDMGGLGFLVCDRLKKKSTAVLCKVITMSRSFIITISVSNPRQTDKTHLHPDADRDSPHKKGLLDAGVQASCLHWCLFGSLHLRRETRGAGGSDSGSRWREASVTERTLHIGTF